MSPSISSPSRLLVAGGCAFDRITTVKRTKMVPGGTGYHAAVAGSLFTSTALVSAAGKDFVNHHLPHFQQLGVDFSGLRVMPGKTKKWDISYTSDFRLTARAVAGSSYFDSLEVPYGLRGLGFVFLGASHPRTQLRVVEQLTKPRMVAVDTKAVDIKRERDTLLEVIKRSQILFVNQEEAALLGGSSNINFLAEKLARLGPSTVIIKLGGEGAIMYDSGLIMKAPAIAKRIIDPTGAGDSFAGAFMGYLASEGRNSHKELVKAFISGNVAASLNVEDFGSRGLLELDRHEMEERIEYLRKYLAQKNS